VVDGARWYDGSTPAPTQPPTGTLIAAVTHAGKGFTIRLDTAADANVIGFATLATLNPAASAALLPLPAQTPHFVDFARRAVPAPRGRATLTVHVAAVVTTTDTPFPSILDGEVDVTFYVFDADVHTILGRPDLMGDTIFNTVLRHLLDPTAALNFKQLGWIFDAQKAVDTLGAGRVTRPAEVLHAIPGDADDDAFFTDSDPARPTPRMTRAELDATPMATCTLPASRDAVDKWQSFLYNNQTELFGRFLPLHATALPPVSLLFKPGTAPIREGLYRKPPTDMHAAVWTAFNEHHADGHIEYEGVDFPKGEVINILAHVFAKKKDGISVRPTLDCRSLNKALIYSVTDFPDMRNFSHQFNGCCVFSCIDYKKMFHTSRYDTASANHVGFLLPDGRAARYRGMVMGVGNSPGIANQQHADAVLTPWRLDMRTDTLPYAAPSPTLDDNTAAHYATLDRHTADFFVDNGVLGTRPDPTITDRSLAMRDAADRHVDALIALVRRAAGAGYRFVPDNCRVMTHEARNLGCVFDGSTCRVDPERIAGFGDLTVRRPITKDYVFHIRGVFVFYDRFVGTLEYQRHLRTFTDLLVTLDKTGKLAETLWTTVHDTAFYSCRDAVVNSMPLFSPDPTKRYYLQVDAATGVGGGYSATFFQYNDRGTRCPIAIISGLWNKTQAAMTPADQELLAIVLGIRKLRKLRYPMHNLTVRSDHSNIRHAFDSTSAVVKRWRFELVGIAIQHVPGKVNAADSLSRASSTQIADGALFDPSVEACVALVTTASASTLQHTAVTIAAFSRSAARAREAEKEEDGGPTGPDNVLFPVEPIDDEPETGQATVDANLNTGEGTTGDTEPHPGDARIARYCERLATIIEHQATLFTTDERLRMADDPSYRRVKLASGVYISVQYGRIVIPSESPLVETLIKECHNAESIHGGITDLKARLEGYTWVSKQADILGAINDCLKCQLRRLPATGGPAEFKTRPPFLPDMAIVLDHIPMPLATDGSTAMLTITDSATRWLTAYPVPDMSAATTLEFFTRYIHEVTNIPTDIFVDGHGAFKGPFEQYCKQFFIKIHESPAYSPQSQGKGERQHAPLEERIRALSAGVGHDKWPGAVARAVYAVRTAHNRTLGASPFFARHGFSPRTLTSARMGLDTMGPRPPDLSLTDFANVVELVHANLLLRNEVTAAVQHDLAMEKFGEAPTFDVGDQVLVHFPERAFDKVSYSWRPGYVVTAKAADPDFYLVSRLESDGTRGDPVLMSARRLASQVGGSTDQEERERRPIDVKPDHYVVESLVGHALDDDGQYYFRARFQGHGPEDDDWVHLPDLWRNCRELLQDYCTSQDIDFSAVKRQAAAERRRRREDPDNPAT
jgi:hypothetical protein